MLDSHLSTGLPGLDQVFKGLIPGDNIVWEVDSMRDYAPFVKAFCEYARSQGKRLVYFRFADHQPLVSEESGAEIHQLQVNEGFEQFITEIHRVIGLAGRGAYLVFDCLSSLAVEWCSDRMLGNFFMLTCPYILDLESLAYFAIYRGSHSVHATHPISETTQIFLELYRHKDDLYIHPIKVQYRYSPTMYMLHAWEGEKFLPVTESSTIAEIQTSIPWAGMDSVRSRLGVWNRKFMEADAVWESVQQGQQPPEAADRLVPGLLRTAISRDDRVLRLTEKYLTLADILGVWKRMIGTGLIGGKSVGMLLARAILRKVDPRWNQRLEAHDSFFIGSDVFYTFLVQNGCWWLRQKQHNPATFLDGAEEARRRILTGTFPDSIQKEFTDMLDYFGQSPIIVRSSSLLEDNFGNAFAGKYDSVFCANQGPHLKRLQDFMSAVRTIYASTMSEKALRYRAQRNILDRDEQMSLLVQRVSGTRYGTLFYPQIAGVGLSFNPYAWCPYIDPDAGMLRLVFGLGTRAVDRSDDDYTRVVALNAPDRRPESDSNEVRQYSQRRVDVIDLEANQLVSQHFVDVARQSPQLPVDMFASEDRALAEYAEQRGLKEVFPWVLTFNRLLSETSFVDDMRQMLRILQDAYDYPVDIEFTANFFTKDRYKINLVQCRPLQVTGGGKAIEIPESIDEKDMILQSHGAVIGRSRLNIIDRLIYVVPSVYSQLPLGERYSVARMIGRLMHAEEPSRPKSTMLVGPGRWGTSTPSLGVPVSFAEINNVAVLCEIVAMRDDLVPDVSLGTHFFNELVEMDILYLALFPGRKGNNWNREFFEKSPNQLVDIAPDMIEWSSVIRVIDIAGLPSGQPVLKLNANSLEQNVCCYLERKYGDDQ
ncbi:MAG: PEP/pyruvate-binding domain-containing protein [Planctomycetota bacterium]